jgi:hypothetical protein
LVLIFSQKSAGVGLTKVNTFYSASAYVIDFQLFMIFGGLTLLRGRAYFFLFPFFLLFVRANARVESGMFA